MKADAQIQHGPSFVSSDAVSHLHDSPTNSDTIIRKVQGHKDCLSNFHPTSIFFDGITFSSSEQCYQFMKAKRCGDKVTAGLILSADHAGQAKSFSKKLKRTGNILEDVDLMVKILSAKAEQSKEFRDGLRAAENWKIVHSTRPSDTFWASGLYPNDDHSVYSGFNIFGRLLEIIRDSLRSEDSYVKPTPCAPPRPILSVVVRRPPLLSDDDPARLPDSPIPPLFAPARMRREQYFQEFPLPSQRAPFPPPPPSRSAFWSPTAASQVNGRPPDRPPSVGPPEPPAGATSRKVCDKCGEPGHTTNDCKFPGPAKCRNCRQDGHKLKFCSLYRAGWDFHRVPYRK